MAINPKLLLMITGKKPMVSSPKEEMKEKKFPKKFGTQSKAEEAMEIPAKKGKK